MPHKHKENQMKDLSKLIETISQGEQSEFGKMIFQNGQYWVVKTPTKKEQPKNLMKIFNEEE